MCRCDVNAAANCSLPASVTGAPAWTQMTPGDCALQFLARADLSGSPRLNGDRNSSGPHVHYWTGAHRQRAMARRAESKWQRGRSSMRYMHVSHFLDWSL